MNRRERFNRTMRFQSVERPINLEFGYWGETIKRWHKEDLPNNCKPIDKSGQDDLMALFFDLDMHWLNCFVPMNNAGLEAANGSIVAGQRVLGGPTLRSNLP